ncbi:MAG TPA: transcription antitermination factor NusB, partial [Bacteroidota bacterium]|nr:transcription antitermination factor NusB [Bacteroidota bacterium]
DHVIECIIEDLHKNQDSFQFAKLFFLKVIDTREELDRLIKKQVANWEFNRLAVIDKIVLRMGICELLYFDDIPPKVSINEAIEIAREFSTEKSDKFVNGVLDAVLDDLKANGLLNKQGRGLQEGAAHRQSTPSAGTTRA